MGQTLRISTCISPYPLAVNNQRPNWGSEPISDLLGYSKKLAITWSHIFLDGILSSFSGAGRESDTGQVSAYVWLSAGSLSRGCRGHLSASLSPGCPPYDHHLPLAALSPLLYIIPILSWLLMSRRLAARESFQPGASGFLLGYLYTCDLGWCLSLTLLSLVDRSPGASLPGVWVRRWWISIVDLYLGSSALSSDLWRGSCFGFQGSRVTHASRCSPHHLHAHTLPCTRNTGVWEKEISHTKQWTNAKETCDLSAEYIIIRAG